jgi:hypothetical protein
MRKSYHTDCEKTQKLKQKERPSRLGRAWARAGGSKRHCCRRQSLRTFPAMVPGAAQESIQCVAMGTSPATASVKTMAVSTDSNIDNGLDCVDKARHGHADVFGHLRERRQATPRAWIATSTKAAPKASNPWSMPTGRKAFPGLPKGRLVMRGDYGDVIPIQPFNRPAFFHPCRASFDRPRGCERPAETPGAAEPRRRRAVKSGECKAFARGQEAAAPLRSAPPGDRKRSPWGDCAPSAWRLATMTFLVRDAAGIGRAAHLNGHGCKRNGGGR